MIMLTRLTGSVFALNADLIERVDTTPDTVVTLVDGKKYVVSESLADVVAAVRRHRGEVIALSTVLQVSPDLLAPSSQSSQSGQPGHPPRLGTVTEHPASRGLDRASRARTEP